MSKLKLNWYHPKEKKHIESVVVFLHGFPGRRTRNEDLAVQLTAKYGVSSLLYRYRGLGPNKGEYNFINTIEDSISIVENLKEEGYKKIFIVGHSFGGFVTLNLLKRIPKLISGVFLMAPLIHMPEGEVIKTMILDFCNIQNGLEGYSANPSNMLYEAHKLHQEAEPMSFLEDYKKLNFTISIVHPREDTVVPFKGSEIFYNSLPDKVSLKAVTDDHWFTQREELRLELFQVVEKSWKL